MRHASFAALGAALTLTAHGAALHMIVIVDAQTGFFAVPASGPVAIDGDASEWDLSGRIESFGDTSVRETYSVRTAAMWDRDALYLFFDWRDPTPATSRMNPAFDPGRGWIADATQLRILSGEHVVWTTTWLYDRRVPSLTYDAMLADGRFQQSVHALAWLLSKQK